ncbi:MAG: pyridoxal phosphate-dependent aminotransferase [bacterium]
MLVKKVLVDKANRLYQLPPDIYSLVPTEPKRSLVRKTATVDLASFTWPVAGETSEMEAVDFRPAERSDLNHLKEELAAWFQAYHGVRVDPSEEIFIGGSISTLMFTIALAFIDSGDIAFVPEMGLPLYRRVTTACGGECVSYTVRAKDNWSPRFERVHTRLGRVATLLFLNSPHNPSGAELSEKELTDLAWLTGRENIIIVNDAAYAAVDARKHVSLLSVSGGKKVGVEVYSFPYHFGLPAAPFGFVVGNREVISGIKLATRLTPGFACRLWVRQAIDGIRKFPNDALKETRTALAGSSAEASRLLSQLNLQRTGFDTVPFIWARIERRRQAATAAGLLYRRHRIMVVPGTAFGDAGEGLLRFSLTAPVQSYLTAIQRLRRKRRSAKSGGDL